MEQGLAHQMTYGSGSDQNTKHFYAGAGKMRSKKKKCSKKTEKLKNS
jgi:hypothetical protein